MTGLLIQTYKDCLSLLISKGLQPNFSRAAVCDGIDLYSTVIELDSGKRYCGYSLGDGSSAFKSTIEATERFLISLVCGNKFLSSSGFALASNLEFAQDRAISELLERDNIARVLVGDRDVYTEIVEIPNIPSWFKINKFCSTFVKIINKKTVDSVWVLNLTSSRCIHSWGSGIFDKSSLNHVIEEALLSSLLKESHTELCIDKLNLNNRTDFNNIEKIGFPSVKSEICFEFGTLVLVKAVSEDLLDYSVGVPVGNKLIYSIDKHLEIIEIE